MRRGICPHHLQLRKRLMFKLDYCCIRHQLEQVFLCIYARFLHKTFSVNPMTKVSKLTMAINEISVNIISRPASNVTLIFGFEGTSPWVERSYCYDDGYEVVSDLRHTATHKHMRCCSDFRCVVIHAHVIICSQCHDTDIRHFQALFNIRASQ